MKHLLPIVTLTLFSVMVAACGEDRSGEQPFLPTVQSLAVVVEADSALMSGQVLASPNSPLVKCGFKYGNDTLRVEALAPAPAETFTAVTKPLRPGRYFAVSFAANGMGTAYGDTLFFTIE